MDKLKDGGHDLIEWIWQNIKNNVLDLLGSIDDKIAGVFGGLFDKLKDIVLAPVHAVQNVFTMFATTVQSYISAVPAPFQVLILISIAGAVSVGLIWIIKRLYELL